MQQVMWRMGGFQATPALSIKVQLMRVATHLCVDTVCENPPDGEMGLTLGSLFDCLNGNPDYTGNLKKMWLLAVLFKSQQC